MAQEGQSPVLVFDSPVMVLHSLVLVFTQSSFNFYRVQFWFLHSPVLIFTQCSFFFYTVQFCFYTVNSPVLFSVYLRDLSPSTVTFRAEKRSAQASAHPLSQAQGGLFCACVGCVQLCLSVTERSSDWDWIKCTRCERFLLEKSFYFCVVFVFRHLQIILDSNNRC